MSRPRGYAPWRPQAKTLVWLDRVTAVLDAYGAHWPLSVRQVFYRLVATAGYDKTEQAYERLCRIIDRGRRAGLLPWEAIRDDGVTSDLPYFTTLDPEQWLAAKQPDPSTYWLDKQDGQPVYTEVWCEAAGMVPMLSSVVTLDFDVPVYSSGGFSSVTALHEAAERMRERDVPTRVLSLADYDASGVTIQNAAEADVVAFGADVAFVRVAVTRDQIDRLGLPTAPPKATDKRRGFTDTETVQAEALAPSDLADIVTAAVRDGWDATAAADVQRRQDEAQEWLREQIGEAS